MIIARLVHATTLDLGYGGLLHGASFRAHGDADAAILRKI
jgi:hypothetical protein